MKNVITLGGDHLDPSKAMDLLLTEHTVYVDEDDIPAITGRLDFEPSPADDHTANWLQAVVAARYNTTKDEAPTL